MKYEKKQSSERFKRIEIKVKPLQDITPVLNRRIKRTERLVQVRCLTAAVNHWYYEAIIDTKPV